jgi:heme/copper-type cytochrome/quinol oxidase subunit 4
MKDFFENSSLLLGVPLLALGMLGLAVGALAALAPEKPVTAGGGLMLPAGARHVAHPGPAEYVMVGGVLAFLTAIEVALYYMSFPRTAFIIVLLVLSALKFVTVVMYFMHLKFDSKLFTTAFVTGMVAAFAVFTVVLVTLGANLV